MRDERLTSIRQVTDFLQLNQTTVYAWVNEAFLGNKYQKVCYSAAKKEPE